MKNGSVGKNGVGRPIYRILEQLYSCQVAKFGEEKGKKDVRHKKLRKEALLHQRQQRATRNDDSALPEAKVARSACCWLAHRPKGFLSRTRVGPRRVGPIRTSLLR